jgi:hypothetical protein
VHEFSVSGTGTLAVRVYAAENQTGATLDSGGAVRLLRNGSTVVGASTGLSPGFAEYAWTGITVSDITDTFQLQVIGSTSHDDSPFHIDYVDVSTVNWVSVRARLQLGSFTS